MTVHARGYRPYAGAFRGTPAAWVVFREGYRTAMQGKAMRRLRNFFLVSLSVAAMALYGAIGALDWTERIASLKVDPAEYSWEVLRSVLGTFYTWVMFLTALVAILAASGIVADDLRARALPLLLVRPLRPVDYAVGKALVVPAVLVWMALLPGPVLLVLVALWQPPGHTLDFLREHVDVVGVCFRHWLVASAAYSGLMLTLSSRTTRRAAAGSIAAGVIFGGTMLQQSLGRRTDGLLGEVLRLLGLPTDTLAGILRLTAEDERWYQRASRAFPDEGYVMVLAAALLVAGILSAWRRARTVEVAG